MNRPISFPIAALSAFLFASVAGFGATATVTMSKTRYSVGESMQILGAGFTPGAGITLTVQRPDKIVDNVAGVAADSNGTFKATYNPPYQPGRYRITATDGTNTAISAVTEADAIGFNKGVYNKGATAYNDTTGTWTTGNAGSNYLENQWAYYQYQITGVTTTVPDFDIAFNHYQSNVNALFVDAFANFRACVD